MLWAASAQFRFTFNENSMKTRLELGWAASEHFFSVSIRLYMKIHQDLLLATLYQFLFIFQLEFKFA